MRPSSSLFVYQHPHLPLALLPLYTSRGRCLSLIPRAEPKDDNAVTNSEDIPVSDPKKPSESGSGFGTLKESKNKRKGKEKRSVIRRSPIERPPSVYQVSGNSSSSSNQEHSVSVNEGAFILTWLSLGFLILIEGIALAASGFLPEEWDNFFVKYLYPSFTPTVVFFIFGTVAYGVVKYLENEKKKS